MTTWEPKYWVQMLVLLLWATVFISKMRIITEYNKLGKNIQEFIS